MTVRYEMIKEVYKRGEHSRLSYGISAYTINKSDGKTALILSIHDITADKKKLLQLIQNCNLLQLSVMHLYDVVEDFLVN